MNIEESSDVAEVSLDEQAKFDSDIPDVSDISAIQQCDDSLIEKQREENDKYRPIRIKTEESSQINETESNVHGGVLDVPELYLDYRPNAYLIKNEIDSDMIINEANNSGDSEVKDCVTEKQYENAKFQEEQDNCSHDPKKDANSEDMDNGDVNELSKNFYNIEVEIARIVGEEVNQDNESWGHVDNETNLHNTGKDDQNTTEPTEIQSSHELKEKENVDHVEASEKKDVSDGLKENIIMKSEYDSNDEEHENSIDEEEIEDYEMFLLNSSIDSDLQKQEETNEVYQTEILFIDPDDTHDAEMMHNRRVKGSDDDNDRQYDIMQLAEVKEVETIHRCSFCQYITSNLSSLRRHVSITHSKNPWTCKYCRKKFTSRFFGEKHIQSEHSRKNRKCPYCSFLTLCSATVMQKHITLVHGFKPVGENDPSRSLKRNLLREVMKCNQCAFSDKSREVMQTHSEMHSLEYVLRCLHCYYMINNRKMYDEHVKSTHKMARKIFICTKCFFQSEEWEEYYSHINSPHDFHSCINCEFKSPYIEIFYNHIRSHENDPASEAIDNELFVCGKCGYKACSNDNLTCHLQAQHSDKSRNERMEHIDDDESISKAESITPIDNMKNIENVIEFEEVEDTEENGIGSKCMHESLDHTESAEDHSLDCERMESKPSAALLEDNGKMHILHPRENILENQDDINSYNVKQSASIESTTFESDDRSGSPQCLEIFREPDESFDESNQHCQKCLFWSNDPKALRAHMLSHNSKSGASSPENECEIVERLPYSLAPEDDGDYRYTVYSDKNAHEFSPQDNVYETERHYVDLSSLVTKTSYNEDNCEEIYSDTHSRGLKLVSSISKKFKRNDSDEENLIEKVTDKPLKIVKVHKHQCFDCLLIYKTRYTLLDHRKKKHGLKKPHSCTYCMANFETYNGLKSHYYRVHRVSYHNSGSFYKCPVCDFTSIRKKHTLKHISRHCGYTFQGIDSNIDSEI